MIWHLHKWSRWRSFSYVSVHRRIVDGVPGWHEIRQAMQEKICHKCGKLQQREV